MCQFLCEFKLLNIEKLDQDRYPLGGHGQCSLSHKGTLQKILGRRIGPTWALSKYDL